MNRTTLIVLVLGALWATFGCTKKPGAAAITSLTLFTQVSLGPTTGATVSAKDLNGQLLGTSAVTDANGQATLTLPGSAAGTVVVVEALGGTFIQESDGKQQSLDSVYRYLVDSAADKMRVPVTPLSEAATILALASSGDKASAARAARDAVNTALGVDLNIYPVDPFHFTASASAASKHYARLLAGLSKLVTDAGTSYITYTKAIAQDIKADAKADGSANGTPVTVLSKDGSTTTPLPNDVRKAAIDAVSLLTTVDPGLNPKAVLVITDSNAQKSVRDAAVTDVSGILGSPAVMVNCVSIDLAKGLPTTYKNASTLTGADFAIFPRDSADLASVHQQANDALFGHLPVASVQQFVLCPVPPNPSTGDPGDPSGEPSVLCDCEETKGVGVVRMIGFETCEVPGGSGGGCPPGTFEINNAAYHGVCGRPASGPPCPGEAFAVEIINPDCPNADAEDHSCTGGCFTKSTLIRMEDQSLKRIERITQNDRVWNPARTRGQAVKRRMAGPELNPLVEIQVNGRVLRVTENHPMRTPRGMVRADSLRVKDTLVEGSGKAVTITGLRRLALPLTEAVYNFELVAPSSDPRDHTIEANGLATGDLAVQEQLGRQRRKSHATP